MIEVDDDTGAARRRRGGLIAAVVAVLVIGVAGILLEQPGIRHRIEFDLATKSGSPTPIGTAVPPPMSDASVIAEPVIAEPDADPVPTITSPTAPASSVASADSADLAISGPPSTPAAAPGAPLRLAAAGDVGTGGAEEWATAAAMDRLEADEEYRALLLLGDNVYEDGDPSKVDTNVFEPFAAVLDGGTALLPVLGNHDVDSGFGDAQVEALGMPGPWYATPFDDVLVISLDSNRPEDAAQLKWLQETLADATETWKIVTMHHPPYSGGWHGSDRRVRDAFVPLFERYGVQLVLTGHDHDYQRTEAINGVTYVVSGGAALLRPTALADFSVAAWSTYHFTDITVWSDHLDLQAVDQNDDVIDTVTLTP